MKFACLNSIMYRYYFFQKQIYKDISPPLKLSQNIVLKFKKNMMLYSCSKLTESLILDRKSVYGKTLNKM